MPSHPLSPRSFTLALGNLFPSGLKMPVLVILHRHEKMRRRQMIPTNLSGHHTCYKDTGSLESNKHHILDQLLLSQDQDSHAITRTTSRCVLTDKGTVDWHAITNVNEVLGNTPLIEEQAAIIKRGSKHLGKRKQGHHTQKKH